MKFYIRGNESLYMEIINLLVFMNEFCIDGKMDWEKLVKINLKKNNLIEILRMRQESPLVGRVEKELKRVCVGI
jgi:hypothetical protein